VKRFCRGRAGGTKTKRRFDLGGAVGSDQVLLTRKFGLGAFSILINKYIVKVDLIIIYLVIIIMNYRYNFFLVYIYLVKVTHVYYY
jgi:hypothetical protein